MRKTDRLPYLETLAHELPSREAEPPLVDVSSAHIYIYVCMYSF